MLATKHIFVAALAAALTGCVEPKVCEATGQAKYRIDYPAIEFGYPRLERVQRYVCTDGTDEWVEVGRAARELGRAH